MWGRSDLFSTINHSRMSRSISARLALSNSLIRTPVASKTFTADFALSVRFEFGRTLRSNNLISSSLRWRSLGSSLPPNASFFRWLVGSVSNRPAPMAQPKHWRRLLSVTFACLPEPRSTIRWSTSAICFRVIESAYIAPRWGRTSRVKARSISAPPSFRPFRRPSAVLLVLRARSFHFPNKSEKVRRKASRLAASAASAAMRAASAAFRSTSALSACALTTGSMPLRT